MKRVLIILAAVAVVAAGATGLGVWWLMRSQGPELPQISAYSNRHVVHTGPFTYCPVLDLSACQESQAGAELPVTADAPVQLSVPSSIGRAPWWLVRVYEDRDNSTSTFYPANSTLAVTVPTVDPQRGKLIGLTVQLKTMVQDENGEQFPFPHAEWAVNLAWPGKPSVG